jgi:hypothetical protein
MTSAFYLLRLEVFIDPTTRSKEQWRVTSGKWQKSDKDRRRKCGGPCTLTINPAAHTSPLRLSTVSSEKMNRFADCENRKSQEKRRVTSDGGRDAESEVRGPRAKMRATLYVHHQPGGPHYPASVIDSFK